MCDKALQNETKINHFVMGEETTYGEIKDALNSKRLASKEKSYFPFLLQEPCLAVVDRLLAAIIVSKGLGIVTLRVIVLVDNLATCVLLLLLLILLLS